jgi:hypothetical protein
MTEFLDKQTAEFRPARVDDLVPGAADWIGRTLTWQATNVIEEGPYAGQWAWQPISHYADGSEPPPFAWVPDEDLVTGRARVPAAAT